jgi:hypothetical protein
VCTTRVIGAQVENQGANRADQRLDEEQAIPFTKRRQCQLPQRPSVIEAQPVFNERGMRGFEPGRQYLRVDGPQVLARTRAQRASEADQVVSRWRRATRPRCRRSVGSLWGRRLPDNLEFRLFRSAAGKPASGRTHLTVFQWLPPILFGCLTLCQACAARCGLGWCHQGWRRHQRQERQTCQEGSHRYPHNPIRQTALSARAALWIYRLIPCRRWR